jgi:ATP-binding cassette subfamily B multidrug efflux pump
MKQNAARQDWQQGIEHPDRLTSYFRRELLQLSIVTVSGLLYNIGLTAGPYFEGQLAQKLYDIIEGRSTLAEMAALALTYFAVIAVVQGARCLKRFYVRRFANDTGRNMRHMLYNHLVHQSRQSLNEESVGSLMTKAVADVDACAEGMRKFTTEVFDTGVALIAYFALMLRYDWRLTLIAGIFTPFAYLIAERVKVLVYRYHVVLKETAGALNDATLERISGAVTYRVAGQERNRDADYEKHLTDYEQASVRANIWETALFPVYNLISMTGVLFILYLGGKNVLGTGFCQWDIAAFTAYLSCFAKMALKSSKASKLFNSVQKAQVSWARIKPLMRDYIPAEPARPADDAENLTLTIKDLAIAYEKDGAGEDKFVFSGLSLTAQSGQIIGVTGPVACGKSTLGKAFLREFPYRGEIRLNGRELGDFTDAERNAMLSYLGHQPELMSDTIERNICYGESRDIAPYLDAVCLTQEVQSMPEGAQTVVGSGGVRLSGGQQARLALARTLYHGGRLLVLDDPFSAVDAATERQIMARLRALMPNAVILILSHRVSLFPEFDQVVWMENGGACTGTHEALLRKCAGYAAVYRAQQTGGGAE